MYHALFQTYRKPSITSKVIFLILRFYCQSKLHSWKADIMKFSRLKTSQTTDLHCVDLGPLLHSLYRPFYPSPLEVNPETKSFSRRKETPFIWVTNVLLVTTFLMPLSAMLILSRPTALTQDELHFPREVLSTGYMFISYFDFGTAWLLYYHCDDIVLGLGRMRKLTRTAAISSTSASNHHHVWRYIAIFSKLSLYELLALLYPLPIFLVWLKLDPFYGLYLYFVAPIGSTWLTYIFPLIRYVLMAIYWLEAVRLCSIFIVILFYWLEMQSKYLDYIERIAMKIENNCTFQFCDEYIKLQIVCQTWENTFGYWIQLCLSTAFLLIVFCAISAIKYASVIPFTVYWPLILIGVFDSGLVYFLFPFVTECKETTEDLLKEYRLKTLGNLKSWGLGWKRKILMRRLNGMRPIAVKCGGGFSLKRTTKCTFSASIIEVTVNGILL